MESNVRRLMQAVGERARAAARTLAALPTAAKDAALAAIADALEADTDAILTANARDLERGREAGLDAALLDRLALNPERVAQMIEGVRQIQALPDPVGEIRDLRYRPSGIQVGKMRVPLGVVGIIYESRPNVTVDAAALCLKSGNAAILRGGSEALESNRAIGAAIEQGLVDAGLDRHLVQVVPTADRAAVGELLAMDRYVDVIIPRGGKRLIERVSREARMPVIKHLDGVCHVYIDGAADEAQAITIADNAKTHRYGVCNAMETLLVDEAIAPRILPPLAALYRDKGVELRGCPRTLEIVGDLAVPASDEDWDTEYLAPILAVRVVDGLDEAIDHIARHGSGHTDAIVTRDYARARRFLTEVDSSSVMVNASTRFADGFEYGLGAEIGISTDKFHVRGPVGLEGLTSEKWIVLGDGHIRQ